VHGGERLYNVRIEMNALFQLISDQEIEAVLPLMQQFYAQQQMRFQESVAVAALQKLIRNPALGQMYLIFLGPELAGYFALTFCFSLEFHGKFALLDELYIVEQFRRRKLGRSVVEFAERICRELHIKALRLEVGRGNTSAQALYIAEGFRQEERNLMTKWL
jgi:ribosomal protein S18 acetylase RimI-like enzyme